VCAGEGEGAHSSRPEISFHAFYVMRTHAVTAYVGTKKVKSIPASSPDDTIFIARENLHLALSSFQSRGILIT